MNEPHEVHGATGAEGTLTDEEIQTRPAWDLRASASPGDPADTADPGDPADTADPGDPADTADPGDPADTADP